MTKNQYGNVQVAIEHLQSELAEARAQNEQLRYKIAQAYQIVGALSEAAGLFDDPSVIQALDHLSNPDGHLSDDLLPWVPASGPLAEARADLKRAVDLLGEIAVESIGPVRLKARALHAELAPKVAG